MAKKKTTEEPAEADATPDGLREPERGEKAELIREILAKHPDAANRDLARLFNEAAAQKKIAMQVSEAGNEFSAARTKANKSDTGRAARPPASSEPTGSELREFKELADEHGGINQLAKHFESLLALVERVGGLEKFQQCLDWWRSVGR